MRVGAKLWQACSLTGDIDEKAGVTVKDRKSLTFVVAPSADDSSDNGQDSRLGTSVNRTSRGTGTGVIASRELESTARQIQTPLRCLNKS